MKIDLCKLFGVEEGEEFKFSGFNDVFCFKNNELFEVRKINDVDKQYILSLLPFNTVVDLDITKLPKKKQFSQDTLNFFKMIDKKYKWIAKDKSGDIFGFEEKPKKDKYVWLCEEYDYCLDNTCCIDGLNQSLFDQILWEDEEPIRIDDYVER